MNPATAIGIILRVLAAAGLLLAVVFVSFQWGKERCKAAYEAANARIKAEHAETVNRAERASTERALAAKEKDLTNAERIKEGAAAQPADPLCAPADIVERLRDIQ